MWLKPAQNLYHAATMRYQTNFLVYVKHITLMQITQLQYTHIILMYVQHNNSKCKYPYNMYT